MEKLLERLGLYDIWTIIFPGIVFSSGLKTLNDYITKIIQAGAASYGACGYQLEIFYPKDIYELMSFVTISYLCGLILHELGSMAKHMIYRNGKPTELLLEKRGKVLNSQQLQMYAPMFLKLNDGQEFSEDDCKKRRKESRNIFGIMNTELQLKGISSKYVKLNLIYNMCFTLCVAIVLLLAYIIIAAIYGYTKRKCVCMEGLFGIAVVLAAACWILYSRAKRYYVYWVRNIVIAYGNYIKKDA